MKITKKDRARARKYAENFELGFRAEDAFAHALAGERARNAKTAWDIASNSRADTFEDLREEVDKAIKKQKD